MGAQASTIRRYFEVQLSVCHKSVLATAVLQPTHFVAFPSQYNHLRQIYDGTCRRHLTIFCSVVCGIFPILTVGMRGMLMST